MTVTGISSRFKVLDLLKDLFVLGRIFCLLEILTEAVVVSS
jgi:hypothetical protein